MNKRTRIILAIFGLLLLAVALAALSYAFAAPVTLREITPLAPTLFTLPAGGTP